MDYGKVTGGGLLVPALTTITRARLGKRRWRRFRFSDRVAGESKFMAVSPFHRRKRNGKNAKSQRGKKAQITHKMIIFDACSCERDIGKRKVLASDRRSSMVLEPKKRRGMFW